MNDESQNMPPSPQKMVELGKNLSAFMAIQLYAVIHYLLGYRFAKPFVLAANAVAMILLPIFFHTWAHPFPFLMPLYGLAALALGVLNRHLRWKEMQGGKLWLSISNGISYLEKIRWPAFFLRENRLVRWIEPLCVLFAGLIVSLFLCRLLGIWIMVQAAFASLFQQMVYEETINRQFIELDGLINSEAQSKFIAFYSGKNSALPPPSTVECEGVSTGLSADLQRAIERKRAKKINAPGNLAGGRV
jgi:hypothetical protein